MGGLCLRKSQDESESDERAHSLAVMKLAESYDSLVRSREAKETPLANNNLQEEDEKEKVLKEAKQVLESDVMMEPLIKYFNSLTGKACPHCKKKAAKFRESDARQILITVQDKAIDAAFSFLNETKSPYNPVVPIRTSKFATIRRFCHERMRISPALQQSLKESSAMVRRPSALSLFDNLFAFEDYSSSEDLFGDIGDPELSSSKEEDLSSRMVSYDTDTCDCDCLFMDDCDLPSYVRVEKSCDVWG